MEEDCYYFESHQALSWLPCKQEMPMLSPKEPSQPNCL